MTAKEMAKSVIDKLGACIEKQIYSLFLSAITSSDRFPFILPVIF